MAPQRAPIVVVEGMDGSGKSTLCARLAERLGAALLRTPPADLADIRGRLDEVFPRHGAAATLLYAATVALASDRARHYQAAGRPVVIDRYWLSTLAYAQVMGHPLRLPDVERELLRPDLTVILTAPLAVRRERVYGRGEVLAHDRATLRPEISTRLSAAFERLATHPLAGRLVRLDAAHHGPDDLVTQTIEELG